MNDQAQTTEIAELPPVETAVQVYQKPGGLDPWLQKIRDEVTSHTPDLSTRKGREQIASLAFKVRKSKSALDSLGKQLVDDLKELPKKIDAERKRMREILDALAEEVRNPLTEWEQAEEARVKRHKDGIEWFRLRAEENSDLDSSELRSCIESVGAFIVDESWEEFEAEAHRIKARAIASLTAALAAREKYEAEQAELAELRRKQAEQDQRDREARIAQEAAEKARQEAEAKARAEQEAAARREAQANAAREQAEREKQEAIERHKQAEARAEAEKLAAEKRAKEAADAARLAEIKRQADEAARIEAEAKAREADKAHKRKIMTAAKESLMAVVNEDQAREIIKLIVTGKVPNVSIKF